MLSQWKEEFDPKLLVTMGEAFDLAWEFIEKSAYPISDDREDARFQLASAVVHLAREGQTNKFILTNRAIGVLRDAEQLRRSRSHIKERQVQAAAERSVKHLKLSATRS